MGLIMFESTGLLLGWAACTYFFAQIFLGIVDAYRLADQQLTCQLIKHLEVIVHRVEVVEHDEMYYWYDQDNRKFLAQGRTTEEIVDTIKSRFPDHIFYFEVSNHLLCAKHNWKPVEASRLPNKS